MRKHVEIFKRQFPMLFADVLDEFKRLYDEKMKGYSGDSDWWYENMIQETIDEMRKEG